MRKEQILSQMKDLIKAIHTKLQKSMLYGGKKKLPQMIQPKSLMSGELKYYQLESLAWMAELALNNLNGILADDMGLGKTIQAISYICYVYDQTGVKGKHLIVVPKNVLRNWEREIGKWTANFRTIILPGTEMEREQCINKYIKHGNFDIIIATYQSVQSAQRQLKKIFWESLMIDEAHSIKNDNTYLAQCLRRYRAKFILLMTGTPLSNELRQLWCLLNFILPDLFEDDTLFSRIEDSVNNQNLSEEEKISYQVEVSKNFQLMINPFLLRRTKSEINLGLKQKKQITLFVSLTELQLKMYRNYLKTRSVYGDPNLIQNGSHVQLRKICAHPYMFSDIEDPKQPQYGDHLVNHCGKLKLLDKLLKKLLKQKHKVLIFSQFVTALKILEDYCTYREYQYAMIDGTSSLDDRDQSVEKFSTSTDTNIFLISTRAGGIGLNLIAADIVVLYDLDWNPQMDKQAMDRAYRIGQKNKVLVFRIVTNNTVEERMLEVQKYKLIWDELVIQKGGLAKISNSDQKLEKMDFNKIATAGAEEIFKLQQNYDDKTIEEIIKMGEQKDMKKTQQIREKLAKQIQAYGNAADPYENFNLGSDSLKNISFSEEQIGFMQKKQSTKPTWRERVKQTKQVIPEAFQFYEDLPRAKELLTVLQNYPEEKQLKECEKQLRSLGFYDWSKIQYEKFVRANKNFQSSDYSSIAHEIQTKTKQQVEQYSLKYFKTAFKISSLGQNYKSIQRSQQEFARDRALKDLEAKLVECPQIQLLRKRCTKATMNEEMMARLSINSVKGTGLTLQENEKLLQMLLPEAYHKNNRVMSQRNMKTAYLSKIVEPQEKREKSSEKELSVEKKSEGKKSSVPQQTLEEVMSKRYEALWKKVKSYEESKLKIVVPVSAKELKEEELSNQLSAQTQIKETVKQIKR